MLEQMANIVFVCVKCGAEYRTPSPAVCTHRVHAEYPHVNATCGSNRYTLHVEVPGIQPEVPKTWREKDSLL